MKNKSPWAWIPSLYFAEGLPYMMIMVVSVIMYKDLGISNSDATLYTSLLYLPWVIKPFWSPLVELVRTNRFWITTMQILMGLCMAGVAFSIPMDNPLRYTMIFFWLAAFSSATHDVAADGYYMIALREDQQSFFVGIRSLFYRVAMWFSQGGLVIAAGMLGSQLGVETGWSIVFGFVGILLALLGLFHAFIFDKKKPQDSLQTDSVNDILLETWRMIKSFFLKKDILIIILFIAFYRFSEAQLGKVAPLFLKDPQSVGGIGLSNEMFGTIYGIVGLAGLVIGGILGGILISRDGLKAWLWPMVIAMNIPNVAYLFLAWAQPENIYLLMGAVAIEQFGYGFGFSAFMMYLIYIARGPYKTAHYAFATGLMALGMMVPGMVSGWIQEKLGYTEFFGWILIATIPAFIITAFLKIDPEFGKKEVKAERL